MNAFDINLEVERDCRGTVRFRAGAIRLSSDKINANRQVYAPDEVCDEEERSGGHSHEDRRRVGILEVGGELGGELRHAEGNTVLTP